MRQPLSIYIHIPFCVRKCKYCDFLSGPANIEVQNKYIEQLLGVKKYRPDEKRTTDEIGLVNGLAWTSVGGDTLQIEVSLSSGKGKLSLTGKLGDVMKESAKAAISYIRSKADALGIAPDFYKDKDIHIHAPEGAIPKDGPSAGVTMVSALVSELTGIPARADVAMTGEISLHGKVMAIGGLREKTMAAYLAGVRTILIPKDNEKDIAELADEVKDNVKILPVSKVEEVLAVILEKNPFEKE